MISKSELNHIINETPVIKDLMEEKELVWMNPKKVSYKEAMERQELGMTDIEEAEARLKRFAPLIMKCFPETKERNGMIESDLIPIPDMQKLLNQKYGADLKGKLLLKQDSHLAIVGSIKARGGIYEVLKHTEELALEHHLITTNDSYDILASEENKKFFGKYTIQVGSTGNLGMSIGIMSAAIGYQAIVHMSSDAKQWKKDLLRSHGVNVIEYETDYSEAVENGRKLSDQDPMSYFVDDENSKNLFLGYAVAGRRLIAQLQELNVQVDMDHPLFVYIPCGVGGAPGGVTFGLKQVFQDAVHCFFVEPTKAPCMLAGMATGLHQDISVKDIGLTGLTHADGLAVGRPSGFVGKVMEPFLSGIFTIKDFRLYEYMRDLLETEKIFLEPSASAALAGPERFQNEEKIQKYVERNHLCEKMEQTSHIVWATGGSLVPENIREEYKNTYLR